LSSSPRAITVVLADDHRLVRTGLKSVLAACDDIEVIGECDDGAQAVALVRELRPDVVLMDLSMPVLDGIEATRELTREVPSAKVVVLTSTSESPRILAAVDAGAVGYLLKDSAPSDILNGIRAAFRGESPVDPRAARALLMARVGQPAAPTLSDRERQVLELVVAGQANKQIARKLGIAEKTVKAHLTSVFQRIGVSDRTQAALWAQRNGLGES
jgi:DNA-binding NarL/FixJ family response regulator